MIKITQSTDNQTVEINKSKVMYIIITDQEEGSSEIYLVTGSRVKSNFINEIDSNFSDFIRVPTHQGYVYLVNPNAIVTKRLVSTGSEYSLTNGQTIESPLEVL